MITIPNNNPPLESTINKMLSDLETSFKQAGGLGALASNLQYTSKEIDTYDPADLTEPGCDEPSIDVRLRYHNNMWTLLSGDSSFDQDHRGHWGASSVGPNLDRDSALSIASDLYEQVAESVAMEV